MSIPKTKTEEKEEKGTIIQQIVLTLHMVEKTKDHTK